MIAVCDVARGDDAPGEVPPEEADPQGWRDYSNAPGWTTGQLQVLRELRAGPDPLEAANALVEADAERHRPRHALPALAPVRPAPPTKAHQKRAKR